VAVGENSSELYYLLQRRCLAAREEEWDKFVVDPGRE
jgi:hypothetical protein